MTNLVSPATICRPLQNDPPSICDEPSGFTSTSCSAVSWQRTTAPVF